MNKDTNQDETSRIGRVNSFDLYNNKVAGIRIARSGGGRGQYSHEDGDFHCVHMVAAMLSGDTTRQVSTEHTADGAQAFLRFASL